MGNQSDKNNEWKEVRRKIKLRWSRFTESEIELFNGHLELIPENIKKSYGSSNARAEQEYGDFRKSLDAAAKAIENLKELAKKTTDLISKGNIK